MGKKKDQSEKRGNDASGYAVTKIWRKKNVEAYRAQKRRRNESSRRFAVNAEKNYTREQDEQIIGEKRPPDRVLSRRIGKSLNGIAKRRWYIKKVGIENIVYRQKNITTSVLKKTSGKKKQNTCTICAGGLKKLSENRWQCEQCSCELYKDVRGQFLVIKAGNKS